MLSEVGRLRADGPLHADPGALYPATPLTDFLRQDAAADMTRGGRMMTVGWVMRPETQMIYRLSSIEGYDAMELSRYRRLLDRASVSSIHETGAIPPSSRPLLDLAGSFVSIEVLDDRRRRTGRAP